MTFSVWSAYTNRPTIVIRCDYCTKERTYTTFAQLSSFMRTHGDCDPYETDGLKVPRTFEDW